MTVRNVLTMKLTRSLCSAKSCFGLMHTNTMEAFQFFLHSWRRDAWRKGCPWRATTKYPCPFRLDLENPLGQGTSSQFLFPFNTRRRPNFLGIFNSNSKKCGLTWFVCIFVCSDGLESASSWTRPLFLRRYAASGVRCVHVVLSEIDGRRSYSSKEDAGRSVAARCTMDSPPPPPPAVVPTPLARFRRWNLSTVFALCSLLWQVLVWVRENQKCFALWSLPFAPRTAQRLRHCE